MPLSEIVNVRITKDVKAVSRASFGTLLIMGVNFNIDGRYKEFSTPASAIAKVAGDNTLEEALITAAFAQSPSVVKIALGTVSASKTNVFSGTFSAGTIKGYVNGTEYSQNFSTDLDTTITALAAKMAVNADVLSCVYTADTNTLVTTPKTNKVIGVVFDITGVTGTLSYTSVAIELAETYPEALDILILENYDWYGLVAATRTTAKQDLIADWTEANKKFYLAGSADLNIIDQTVSGDTTSIAALVKNKSLERTAVVFTKTAATEGAEAALMAKLLVMDPGTYTAMFKTLASITVDNLTVTQSTNARNKYANVYESIGGVNIIREGKVAANEYIDIVIFIDWLTARITESVYSALVSQPKVPYTVVGLMVIKSAIDQPLKIGQNRGGISPTLFDDNDKQIGGYYIEIPEFADIPTADKTARLLQDVKFTAYLAGAIHQVVIDGVVTL